VIDESQIFSHTALEVSRIDSFPGCALMQRFLIFLAIFSVLLASCTKSSKDKNSKDLQTNACGDIGLDSKTLPIGKIINGTACENKASAVVFLEIEFGDASAACTGTMLTSTDVLTASHCFPFEPTSILVGNTIANVPSVSASRVSIHPGAAPDPLTGAIVHDIAIVHLSKPLSVPTLPIFASHPIEDGDAFSIFGYGQDERKKAGTLKSGQMRASNVSGDFIVADFDGKEGSNTCFGDSGGPAIFTAKRDDGRKITGVVGTTSTGTADNCGKGDSSAFADVQLQGNLDFIRSKVPGVRIE
jgi:secreted trypsin-like serine protease